MPRGRRRRASRTSPLPFPQASSLYDFVQYADNQEIAVSLKNLLPIWQKDSAWLGPANSYSVSLSNPPSGSASDAAAYVSASAVLHVFDGWNYLSRAFDALLRGDRHTAIHLAYYAELRSAMSLLASQGVGVFNTEHISVGTGPAVKMWAKDEGTHKFVWRVLIEWAQTSDGIDALFSNIAVDGASLEDWLKAFGADRTSLSALTFEWLSAWSLDVDRFRKDRDLRNGVSYRPDSIRWPPEGAFDALSESIDPILDAWNALAPLGLGQAGVLDLHLLREALDFAYAAKTGLQPGDGKHSLYVDSYLRTVPVDRRAFLTRARDPNSHAILVASDRSRDDVVAVMSRAILILRLASASANGLLRRASVTVADIQFWLDSKLTDLGLWDVSVPMTDFTDLWDEVRDDIRDVESWRSSQMVADTSLALSQVAARTSITQFQRPNFWLLAN